MARSVRERPGRRRARLARAKDEADLAITWPLLGAVEQDWLREAVRGERADHPWLGRMT